MPSAAFAQTVGFLQAKHTKASTLQKVHAIVAGAAQTYRSQPLSLLAYSLRVQLKLKTDHGDAGDAVHDHGEVRRRYTGVAREAHH